VHHGVLAYHTGPAPAHGLTMCAPYILATPPLPEKKHQTPTAPCYKLSLPPPLLASLQVLQVYKQLPLNP
jgi:hypothetical protein